MPVRPPMFRRHAIWFVFANALLVVSAGPSAAPSSAALQWPGDFHGEETRAHDGETWLALRRDADRVWLETTVVRVEPVHDPIVDGEHERSGRRVSTPALADEPLVLLQGADLAAGSLLEAPDASVSLADEGVRRIEARGLPALELALECDEAAPGPEVTFDCALEVRDALRVQVLHVFTGSRDADGNLRLGDDGGAEVRFAGDLDRDGHLDLILDLRDHYNVQRTQLWLSGDAAGGDLLRLSTTTEVTGC